ncbi:hypothetical protein F511_38796 [Dorcoceras hygrometricum]|uniref:Uncharacterized protein n=1 Tax=Dorcoceras hygrometricum TaxID=472368 RepID=A0A2Z7BJ55_9LAMI|nr:hypothetical protein F511_38796 [Dorcoceras hygrometricum]
MLHANWDTLSTSWGTSAGSKPRPAEKPGKPENTYKQQYTSPRGTSGSNPSTETNTNSIRKAIDKYANAMQGIKATTESREPKDRNNSSTARSDQRKENQWPRGLSLAVSTSTYMLYANWDTLSTSWGTSVGSKPRPAEKPGKPENTYKQHYTSPRGTSGSNPSTETNTNSIRKATNKYANAMQGIKATTECREPKDRNNSSTARSDQRKENQWPRAANKPSREMRYGSYSLASEAYGNYPLVLEYSILQIATMMSRAHISTTCSTETHKTSGTEAQKTAAGSYELHQRYPTSLTQQKALNKLKGKIYTYPKKLGAKSDAYANRLHKGDVFAHLTSLKQTFENNIQMKRLIKRSPTLQLLLSSELPTIGNQIR